MTDGRNGRPPVDLGGMPVVGEGPPVEPVPRALIMVSASRRAVYQEQPGAVNVPPVVPGVPRDARVIGDPGEIALWAAALVMLDHLATAQADLVERLEAAGVIAPRPGEPPTP